MHSGPKFKHVLQFGILTAEFYHSEFKPGMNGKCVVNHIGFQHVFNETYSYYLNT
jgi:hypothetical protein